METQRTANTHLLARDGPPGQLGSRRLAPLGAPFLRLAPCLPSPVCLACGFLVRRCPRLPFCWLLVASPALRTRHSCPWRLTGVSLLTAPAVLPALGSQRIFCPSLWCSASPFCLMSRGDELRQLAAQLSVLAALEDSIALGLSRVMGPAGSGRSAAPPAAGPSSAPAATAAPPVVPSPSHEVAASLLRSASLRAASPRTRTRSRSPAPLPKRAPRRSSSVASGLRGSVALAETGLVTGLATKSCPPVLPPQLPLSRVSRALHAASAGSPPPVDASGPPAPLPRPPRPLVLRSLRPTPMTNGTLSLTHTASLRLLVAPRPPSPSRPTPLVLVGVLATSVAVASAKPPNAPCGGKSDVLSPMLCAFSAGVASLAVGLFLDTSTLLRITGKTWWTWSFPARPAQDVGSLWRCWCWPWRGGQFGYSEDAEKPNKSYFYTRKRLREVEFVMMERVQLSRVDHSNVNWSRSQHVCMKPPLAVIFTFFCVRQTHWTCGCAH